MKGQPFEKVETFRSNLVILEQKNSFKSSLVYSMGKKIIGKS